MVFECVFVKFGKLLALHLINSILPEGVGARVAELLVLNEEERRRRRCREEDHHRDQDLVGQTRPSAKVVLGLLASLRKETQLKL